MIYPANSTLVKTLFFGNYFYGLCAVALSLEASLQQRFPVNELFYYLLVFTCTVVYYSKAYLITEVSVDETNVRSAWYASNRGLILKSQYFFILVIIACGSIFIFRTWHQIAQMYYYEWLLIFVFPFAAILYYGEPGTLLYRYNLRNIGWLKPFTIGFTWAGMVTVYPVLYFCLLNKMHYDLTLVSLFLFIKNFMYITLLCIMFDIKDYAMDYNKHLKTLVVKMGVRKTIFLIIIPLCIAGLASFIGYAFIHDFHPVKILLNTVPFLLVILVAYTLHSRHTIFYYLVIIDGLMLLKALCGITGMVYF
jgi:4-hydroxybenzoate polyprenyltransferase